MKARIEELVRQCYEIEGKGHGYRVERMTDAAVRQALTTLAEECYERAAMECMDGVEEDCDCSMCTEGRIHRDAIRKLKEELK